MKRVLTMVALALAAPAGAVAQGWIEPMPNVAPTVRKVRTAVTVRVTDRVARVEVEEWFRNDGGGLAEGDYLYPLPGEAAFSDFSLFQGDVELRGETMDAERARAIYEEIVRRKKDPALIELAGHGLVRARVFPINAGETRKITLRFTQVLRRAGDALEYRYAAAGRNAGVPSDPERGHAPVRVREAAPSTFLLIAENGGAFAEPFSPTHALRSERDGNTLRVRPAGELEGDVVVFLPLARPVVGVTVATHRASGEDGFFMLTLSPGRAQGRGLPRDVAVVVDVSGSMSGEKMEQARQALRQLLGTLESRDRFRLISFNNTVSAHSPDWVPATPVALRAAREWVGALTPGGGTNIDGALAEAFAAAPAEGRLPIVVFLTDGIPSAGETNPERIAQRAESSRGAARVFAFGIGYDVNTVLLDRLTAAGRGATEYIEPAEDVETAVSTLAMKVQHPVLMDLRIQGAPVRLSEVYPVQLPDLFAGEELVVFGRYAGSGAGELTISGVRGGQRERFATRAGFAQHERGNDYIPRLWAARKVGWLMQTIRLEDARPELVAEIRDLALRYGILTEYTSYLVLEPEVMADGTRPPGPPILRGGATGAAAPPPPAPAAVGRDAVASAKAAQERRVARSEADLRSMDAAAAEEASRATRDARVVAGRRFELQGGVWMDVTARGAQREVAVEAFSPAYFQLLERLPELKPYLSSFERVVVSGARVSLRVTPAGGARQLGAAEIERIVREFRNRG